MRWPKPQARRDEQEKVEPIDYLHFLGTIGSRELEHTSMSFCKMHGNFMNTLAQLITSPLTIAE